MADETLPTPPTAAPTPTPKRSFALRLRHRVEYTLFLAVYGLLAALPLWLALPLSATAAATIVGLDRRRRRIGLVNLGIAFPEKPAAEREAILRASCRNLGRMIAECAHLHDLTYANVHDLIGFENEKYWKHELIAALRERGVVILTGHFGNWELFHHAHGLLGYPVDLVHQTIKNPLIDAFVERLRQRAGTRLMRKHGAARGVLRAIADNGLVVLPLDQNASRRTGIFVDFFGRAASTNAAVGRIVARTGAPVFPAFLVREGTSAKHRIVILPRLSFASMADRDQVARDITQRCTAMLEEMIRRHPDHWLWTHKRWRTRPTGEQELY